MNLPVSFDPTQPAVIRDPFPALHALMEHDPVHWSDRVGGWVFTRYEHVKNALRDPMLSADRIRPFFARLEEPERSELAELGDNLALWSVFNDPPAHTRLRGLMNKAFTSRAVAALRPSIAGIVEDLLGAVLAKGRMDVIGDFSYPLPATVIADMLGVPRRDVGLLKKWSDQLNAFVGGARATPDKYRVAAAGIAEMTGYFQRFVGEHRRLRRDDVTSGLIAAEEDGQQLTADELVATCVLLLFAGHETTTHLIANGLLALIRHPQEMADLRAHLDDPALVASAVEEMLRYDGPILSVVRIATEDFTLEGKRIRKGQRLFLMISAANRDPRAFAEADRFDIRRDDNRHVGFGFGIHFCVGAPLARLEAQVAFPALLRRCADLRLLPPEAEWSDNFVIRGMHQLNVAFRRAD
jgi:cytochrome P450